MKYIFVVFAVCWSLTIKSQSHAEYEILKDMAETERKALMAENLFLTDEESKLFWPMYNEYRKEKMVVFDEWLEVMKKFSDNFQTLTDDQATQLMTAYSNIRLKDLKINAEVKKKMSKSLSSKTVMRFVQLENKLAAYENFESAMQIPLVLNK